MVFETLYIVIDSMYCEAPAAADRAACEVRGRGIGRTAAGGPPDPHEEDQRASPCVTRRGPGGRSPEAGCEIRCGAKTLSIAAKASKVVFHSM